MKRAIVVILIVCLNFILQATLFRYIAILGVKPNTALLIVVSFAVLRGDVEGALIGFFAGLLMDLAFERVIGYYALLGAVTGWLCGKPFSGFYRENYIFPALLSLIAAAAWELAYYLTHPARAGVGIWLYGYRAALPSVAYTMILCVPVFAFIYWVNRRLDGKRKNVNIR